MTDCEACKALKILGTDQANYIHTMSNPVGAERELHEMFNEQRAKLVRRRKR